MTAYIFLSSSRSQFESLSFHDFFLKLTLSHCLWSILLSGIVFYNVFYALRLFQDYLIHPDAPRAKFSIWILKNIGKILFFFQHQLWLIWVPFAWRYESMGTVVLSILQYPPGRKQLSGLFSLTFLGHRFVWPTWLTVENLKCSGTSDAGFTSTQPSQFRKSRL